MGHVSGTAPDGRMHAGRVESLHEQVPTDAPDGRRFIERYALSQPPVERLLDQEVFIEVAEDLRHRCPRHVAREADRVELTQRPQPPVTLHVRFCSRAGQRCAAVVQGALALQARHGLVDVVRLELTSRQARPDLRFAQLASSEHLESGDVGAGHGVIVGYPSVISARTFRLQRPPG